jgi:serine protease inhibitor
MNIRSKGGRETPPTVKTRRYSIGNGKWAVIALALVALLLISYGTLIHLPAQRLNAAYAASDERAAAVDPRLVSANTQFAFNLFRELVAEDGDKNIAISPLSVSLALAMTYNGAGGTTRDAMAHTLGFNSMTLDDINQAYLDLIESLENADQAVQLLIANSVWTRSEFAPLVKASFIDQLTSSYQGEMFTRDFGNPQTISEINGWVDKHTEGKIDDIIHELSSELVMLLINAIYFKGTWIVEFDEADTHKQNFFLPDGDTSEVDMMATTGNFSYASRPTCQIARLPYGRDKVAMYIFLPHEGIALDAFIAGLNQTTHDEYLSTLAPADLTVKLPKFEVEYGVKRLNNVLRTLGMDIAFQPSAANFSNIASTAPENLYISFVDHKAIVEVNEQGTEAAAATSVGVGITSVSPSVVSFIVDRPFYFEIRDDRSGTILFMGKMLNPAGA